MFTQDWTGATKILYAKYKLTRRIPVSCEGSNGILLKMFYGDIGHNQTKGVHTKS